MTSRLTTDRRLARAWAGIWTIDGKNPGGGELYQVEIDPSLLEPDDDFLSLSGRFFQIRRAQVSLVYDPYVRFHEKFRRNLEKVSLRACTRQAGPLHRRPSSHCFGLRPAGF